MAQADGVVSNGTGSAVRTDINNQYAALWSNHSGSTEPSSGKVAYQFWADTNANILKIRNSANNAWISLFTLAGGIDVDAASNFNEDVTFTGASSKNAVWDKSDGALEFADNAKCTFGAGDLEIYHDASSSYVYDAGTGPLILGTNNSNIQIKGASSAAAMMAEFKSTEGCELYFDGVKRMETDSNGAIIHGRVEGRPSDSGTVDAGLFYNNYSGANADTRVLIKTYSNQGADPFIKFDSGGNNFIVGQRWVGTSNNYLCLGRGESPSSTFAGLQITDAGNGALTGTLSEGSDISLKKNVVTITEALSKVKQLRGVEFDKIATDVHEIGCIAQEVQSVIPEVVQPTNSENPLLSLSYSRLTAVLIEAIKELSAEVETVKTKVAVLEAN